MWKTIKDRRAERTTTTEERELAERRLTNLQRRRLERADRVTVNLELGLVSFTDSSGTSTEDLRVLESA